MTDTEFITKEIFQYEKNSEKQEQIIEKQDIKLKENDNTIAKLKAEVEELHLKNVEQQKKIAENDIAIEEKEEIIFELKEANNAKSNTIRIYRNQVDEYKKESEGLHSELVTKDTAIAEQTKRIEELERASLSPSELLFYYACKSDLVLFNYAQEGKLNLTYEELKIKKIPIEFLEQVKKKPFETTNYVLTFTDNIYRIKSSKK